MRILISAIACSPDMGSEPYVGWHSAVALSERHDVWVLTSCHKKEVIEQAQKQGMISQQAHFIFVEAKEFGSRPTFIWRKIQEMRGLAEWNRNATLRAKALVKEIQFDIAHHVTFATWRQASPLHGLKIPFVWGPVGGGENINWSFYPMLGFEGILFELMRVCSNGTSLRKVAVKQCARAAAHIFAANSETFQTIQLLGPKASRLSKLCQIFFPQNRLRRFSAGSVGKALSGPLRLFGGGSFHARKAIPLALRALAQIRDKGIEFRYILAGWGPEKERLVRLRDKLGLAELVQIRDGITGDEYANELARSHIFLLPSLRESAGATLMEAMLSGCVPIVVGGGGPGEIVGDTSGIRINPRNPDYVVNQIGSHLVYFDSHRENLAELGANATRRIVEEFSQERYLERVETIYNAILTCDS